MTVDISKISIPPLLSTLDNLNVTVPDDVGAHTIAPEWLAALAAALEADNLVATNSLFVEDSWWRDMLSLTHTFRGRSSESIMTVFLARSDQIYRS